MLSLNDEVERGSTFYAYERLSIHCLYFIHPRKIYVRTHRKITRQWKSNLRWTLSVRLRKMLTKVGRQEVLMLKAQAKRNIKSFLVLFPFNEFKRSLLLIFFFDRWLQRRKRLVRLWAVFSRETEGKGWPSWNAQSSVAPVMTVTKTSSQSYKQVLCTCNWNVLKPVYGNIKINWKTINK